MTCPIEKPKLQNATPWLKELMVNAIQLLRNISRKKLTQSKRRKVGKYIKILEIVRKKIKKIEFKFHRRTLSPKRPRRYGRLFIEYLNRAMLK